MKFPSVSAITKKIGKHRFLIAGVAVTTISIAAIAITAVLTLTADKDPGAPDVFWASHIKGHTGGEISKTSTINIIFNSNIVDKDDIGKEVDGVFSFDPSLKGKAEWVSENEIVFVPEKHMPAGQKYLCTLNLDDYIKKADGVDDFFFGFSIIEPNFDIKLDGFRFPKLENLNIQDYEGSIKTADFEDSKAIEKILEASQKGKNLEIEWKHSSETKTHNFTIKNISRGKSPSELLLKWDGSSINSDRSGEHRIEIHARDVFKVSSIEVISSSEKYVELTFTDPLKQNQNLRGLIYFEEMDSRTEIDMNIVRVFPTGDKIGDADIRVERGVLNSEGKKLNEAFHRRITFQKIDPGVRFIGDGTILPDTDNLTVPFEAVNVHSLQVTVFKVYDKNMGQFFQVNDFKQNNEIKRVGRYLWRKTIKLNATPAELSRWSRYNLDVSSLYNEHPGSLFRIELSINRSNSALGCSDNPDPAIVEPDFKNQEGTIISDSSYWDYWEEYDHGEYWDNRKNPCHDAYYKQSYGNPVFSAKNFISSNIGITAKYGSGKALTVITTDIVDASPASANIKIYNFQNAEIGSGSTDSNGFADIAVSGEGDPFYIVAERRGQKGYLKLSGASQLITSHFDVGGEKVKDGLKGYIYGERGVWSPGDNIYLTFVLEDKDNLLPKNHPVTMKLYDPRGRLKQVQSAYRQSDNFYAFELKTDSEDETGSWTARAELGGLSFTKTLKIETVKPNRLKVELDIGGKELHRSKMPVSAKINSQWLHGATAQNLTTDVSARFSGLKTEFSRYTDYVFDDLTRTASSEKTEIFSGTLDSAGKASFSISFSDSSKPAGMLNAYFTSRVFEPGGDFSSETLTIPYHPYTGYVGIKTPKGDATRGMLLTDKKHTVSIATVDSNGKPVSRSGIDVKLYKIEWRWWWDKSGESLANFASSSNTRLITEGSISTRNGSGKWTFEVKYPEWGRYLLRAEDPETGHASSRIVYIDWPGWAGRAQEEKGVGATRLNFTLDKEKYKPGDKATLYIPETKQGIILLTIENGRTVLDKKWIKSSEGENRITIPVTKEMSPNAYINVALIQPHKGRKSDGPIRMYGIVPIMVEDPEVVLTPEIRAPKEIKPKQKTSITVSEKNGRSMNYTIAIVDEGLLGLTGFRAPDLKDYFYKREALGVKTWDLYDDIVGAYGGELNRVLALGGGEGTLAADQLRESRFKPIVRFMGPFELKSREKRKHEFELDPYIGSVRIMVVAGADSAYGSTEESVFVRQPLMVSGTMPAVVGPGEEVYVPVTVFSKDKSIRKVSVNLSSTGNISFPDGKAKTVSFSGTGNKIAFFKVKTGNSVGRSSITFKAQSGSESDEQTINFEIRSPNPLHTDITYHAIDAGKKWSHTIKPVGLANTNSAVIELSVVPPIHLEKRIGYLITYPHGCLEQTVSSAFPQLYLGSLTVLDTVERTGIESNVNEAISRISSMQNSSGSFNFWASGRGDINDWANIYAGHFLVEAQKAGYSSAAVLLGPWKSSQRRLANSWRSRDRYSVITQAYRLYALAISGSASMPAMNRFKDAASSDPIAQLLLAAAYYHAGETSAAKEIAKKASIITPSYSSPGLTFGSSTRDNALMLMCLADIKDTGRAKKLADSIGAELSSNRWLSTQTTAFALLSMSKLYGGSRGSHNFSYTVSIGGKSVKKNSSFPIVKIPVRDVEGAGANIEITNSNSDQKMFVTIASSGSPAPGKEKIANSGLDMSVSYSGSDGVYDSISSIRQGEDVTINISVRNTTTSALENIAVTHMVPSGWTIHNTRLESGREASGVIYQDFRYDRIYTYISLNPGETKTITSSINASFAGRYYLPAITAEDMYVADRKAGIKGEWTEVVK